MAKKEIAGDSEVKQENKLVTAFIVALIIIIWLAIFILLIKFDIGGFGSGVLRPVLKNVPVINWILPSVSDEQIAKENDYEYSSLTEAVAKIKELEQTIKDMDSEEEKSGTKTTELQAEIDRLKVFEENQKAFEEKQLEFDKNVVFAEAAPELEEYKKYYEEINPANAEIIYRQVVEQLQYSDAIKEKANIYKSMDPEAAAKILETMSADVESVSQILLCMKPKESAEILAEMDPVFAAKVTKKMLALDDEKLADK